MYSLAFETLISYIGCDVVCVCVSSRQFALCHITLCFFSVSWMLFNQNVIIYNILYAWIFVWYSFDDIRFAVQGDGHWIHWHFASTISILLKRFFSMILLFISNCAITVCVCGYGKIEFLNSFPLLLNLFQVKDIHLDSIRFASLRFDILYVLKWLPSKSVANQILYKINWLTNIGWLV